MTRLVHIVEDDPGLRSGLARLLRSVGIPSRGYGSGEEFLSSWDREPGACVLSDIRLPDLTGLELQERLSEHEGSPPMILMTGYGDVPMSVRAMKAGAVDFLAKPFRDQEILEAVTAALARAELQEEEAARARDMQARFASLSPREREVLAGTAAGMSNGEIAAVLGLSAGTVKIHRAGLMRKMGMRSSAVLVRAARALGVQPLAG